MYNLTNLYKYALDGDWQWARAIARVESSENPFEVGDSGYAFGLWQMHKAFIRDYVPELVSRAWEMDVIVQAVALAEFWRRHNDRTILERVAIFHLGARGFREGGMEGAQDYIRRVNDAHTDD